jgi:hypothetical protein
MIPTTSVLEYIRKNSVKYWNKWTVLGLILGILDLFINTDRPASYKAAGHRSRYFCKLQLEHMVSALAFDPPHFSKEIGDHIPPIPGLFTE